MENNYSSYIYQCAVGIAAFVGLGMYALNKIQNWDIVKCDRMFSKLDRILSGDDEQTPNRITYSSKRE